MDVVAQFFAVGVVILCLGALLSRSQGGHQPRRARPGETLGPPPIGGSAVTRPPLPPSSPFAPFGTCPICGRQSLVGIEPDAAGRPQWQCLRSLCRSEFFVDTDGTVNVRDWTVPKWEPATDAGARHRAP